MRANNITIRRLAYVAILCAVGLLAASGLGAAGPRGGLRIQDLSPDVLPEHRDALRRLSRYDSGPRRAEAILDGLGFDPTSLDGGLPGEKWKAMPALRKIEYAYLSAEAAEPAEGGGRFLALLSRRLAQDYPALRHEPAVQPLFEGAAELSVPVRYAQPTQVLPTVDLPPDVLSVLRTLSRYAEGSPWGGARHILQHSFGLSTNATWELLRSSESTEAALLKGLSSVAPKERDPALRRAVADVTHRYPKARGVASLAPWIEPAKPLDASRVPELDAALRTDLRDLRTQLFRSTRGAEGAAAGADLIEAEKALDASNAELAEVSRKIEAARESIEKADAATTRQDSPWLGGRRIDPPQDPPAAGRPTRPGGPDGTLLPDRFDTLFPRAGATSTADDLTRDLRRAPGGVIVDLRLEGAAPVLSGIRFPGEGASSPVEVQVDGEWMGTTPPLEAGMLRAAYGFVLDQRAVAIDLRPPDVGELHWLVRNHPELARSSLRTNLRKRKAVEILHSLTSVNLHPALKGTLVGEALIAADQLIFDLLPSDVQVTTAQLERRGIELSPLRAAYNKDEERAHVDDSAISALHYKSILTVTAGSWSVADGALHLDVELSFDLYWMPIHYERSSAWFNGEKASLIKKFPKLDTLSSFASAAVLCRMASAAGIEENLRPLLATVVPQGVTPRFLEEEKKRWRPR